LGWGDWLSWGLHDRLSNWLCDWLSDCYRLCDDWLSDCYRLCDDWLSNWRCGYLRDRLHRLSDGYRLCGYRSNGLCGYRSNGLCGYRSNGLSCYRLSYYRLRRSNGLRCYRLNRSCSDWRSGNGLGGNGLGNGLSCNLAGSNGLSRCGRLARRGGLTLDRLALCCCFLFFLGVVTIVIATDARLHNFFGDIFELAQVLVVVVPSYGPVAEVTVDGTEIEIALGSSA